MNEERDQTEVGPPYRRGRPPALPVIRVESREDMAVMLAMHNRLLRDRARQHLGRRAKDEAVEQAVDRTIRRLLTMEAPSTPNGLRFAMKLLWAECRRVAQRQERQAAPVDRFLGPLTHGPVARLLNKLGPRQRRTILLAGQGLSPAEIARLDDSTPGSVRVRLARARARLNKLLEEGSRSASGFAAVAAWRTRDLLARGAHELGVGAVPNSLAATILVPLIASSLLWAAAPQAALTAAPPLALAPSRSVPQATRSTATPVEPDQGGAVSTTRWSSRPASTSLPSVSASPDLHGAAAETPDDVTLTAIATPADGRPVLVAIGKGNTCRCPVLMQSLDGGATWASTDGPPADANQLVVPPNYPRDARIFAGVDPILGKSPYVAAAFRQPFRALTTLPPGHLAVSSHFDDGDPRLFSAGSTALWSVTIAASSVPAAPRDEVDYSGAAVEATGAAALATPPPSSNGPAVLAWVPAPAAVPGSPRALSTDSTVVHCPVASPCTATSNLPAHPWRLDAESATVLAYTGLAVYVSHDDGRSFASLPLPKGVSFVESLALAGEGVAPWGSFERADGSFDVARLLAGDDVWADAAGDSVPARTRLGRLLAVGQDRIIEAFSTVGYRCTMIAGGPWLPRCPPV